MRHTIPGGTVFLFIITYSLLLFKMIQKCKLPVVGYNNNNNYITDNLDYTYIFGVKSNFAIVTKLITFCPL